MIGDFLQIGEASVGIGEKVFALNLILGLDYPIWDIRVEGESLNSGGDALFKLCWNSHSLFEEIRGESCETLLSRGGSLAKAHLKDIHVSAAGQRLQLIEGWHEFRCLRPKETSLGVRLEIRGLARPGQKSDSADLVESGLDDQLLPIRLLCHFEQIHVRANDVSENETVAILRERMRDCALSQVRIERESWGEENLTATLSRD